MRIIPLELVAAVYLGLLRSRKLAALSLRGKGMLL